MDDVFHKPWGQASIDAILAPFLGSKTPVFLHMNARDYADIRKFGRDVLRIESNQEVFKTGLMAFYADLELRVSRSEDEGQISVKSMCGLRLAVLKDGCSVQLLPDSVSHAADCADCLAHSVMAS